MDSTFVPFPDSVIDPALLALELTPQEPRTQAKSPELPSQPADLLPTHLQEHDISDQPDLPSLTAGLASPSDIAAAYIARPPLDGRPVVRSRALNLTKTERKAAAEKAAEKKRNMNVDLQQEWEHQFSSATDLALKYGITLKKMRTFTQHQPGTGKPRKVNLWNAWLRANSLKINEGKSGFFKVVN